MKQQIFQETPVTGKGCPSNPLREALKEANIGIEEWY